jgi:hypothetical protein
MYNNMCVVSMIGDHFHDKWKQPNYVQQFEQIKIDGPSISKEDFDSLKKEVLEMKELLKKAIKYDKDNNEPDCEVEEKLETLKKVAALLGVDLNDVLNKKDDLPNL